MLIWIFIIITSYYTAPLYLAQEMDGLRIITSDKNEFLQVVPKELRDVFEIAASDPSSTLYEASIAFYDVKIYSHYYKSYTWMYHIKH